MCSRPSRPGVNSTKGAEVGDLDDLAVVDVPGLHVFGHPVYRGDRALRRNAVNTGHVDRAAVLDGDVDAVLLLEGVYGLAARVR